jgi:hypothetical protein
MQSMLGNPWNPMPGWLFPGLLDESIAPSITLFNRGCFDAVGVPYAFQITANQPTDREILRRVLRTTGDAGFAFSYFIDSMEAAYGPEGLDIAYRFLNDQFCWSRNTIYTTPPDPFWSPSPQVFPMWKSETWTLVANCYRPPGAKPGQPTPEQEAAWRPGDRPFPSFGDDLKRWSLFKTDSIQIDAFGDPKPYDLWQTYLDGTAESLPADQYRAGAFPFPELVLYGMTSGEGSGAGQFGVYGQRAVLRPWNP